MNIEQEIEMTLNLSRQVCSRNTLSQEKVKSWLRDFMTRYDDERQRLPELQNEPDFDLLMADNDKFESATFVVVVLHQKKVSIVVGHGESSEIRRFAENEFPENILEVIPELANRFEIFEHPLSFTRSEFDRWLAA
jgi:hypothetical protein